MARAILTKNLELLVSRAGVGADILIRTTFPDVALTVDANAAYTAADLDHLGEMDQFGLSFVEQPFQEDALLLHAELQARLETDVCLDESITSPERCGEALELDAARVVNIKPGRLGGHGPSLRVHDLCERANVPVWCGGMLESGVGRAHNVALASLPNMRLPGDTSASARYWERDVVVPAFELAPDGTVAVPNGPGQAWSWTRNFSAPSRWIEWCCDDRPRGAGRAGAAPAPGGAGVAIRR